jgi:hypothetical protein
MAAAHGSRPSLHCTRGRQCLVRVESAPDDDSGCRRATAHRPRSNPASSGSLPSHHAMSSDSASTTLEGFTAALVLNLVIAAVAVLAFCLLRPYFPGIYAPRALRLCARARETVHFRVFPKQYQKKSITTSPSTPRSLFFKTSNLNISDHLPVCHIVNVSLCIHFFFFAISFSVGCLRLISRVHVLLLSRSVSACGRTPHGRRKNAPTVPSDRFCSWFAASLKIDDEQLLDSIGLDALMYLKYLKLGFQLFLAFAVIGARV